MSLTPARAAIVAALVLAIGVPSAAIAFGEGEFLKLGQRNPSPNGTLALNSETEIIAENGSYGTRQSNKKDGDGGGAIYGCRSNPGSEPCIRSNNLKGGRAFEFASVGKEGGRIELGDRSGAPLTTNATGVATGFNADQVDGKNATDLAAAGDLAFAAVDATGKLTADRGAASASISNATNGTYAVVFDREVRGCSFTASPQGASTASALGVAASESDPKTVLVDQPDAVDARTGFHLQVIC